MFTFALSLLFACGEKSTDTAETTDTAEESTDTTEESTETTDTLPGTEESEGNGEMGDYVASYCSEYALRCGVYSDQEYCESDIQSWYNETCIIVDTDALNTCVTWLSELSCDYRGWIDECSNFYSCD